MIVSDRYRHRVEIKTVVPPPEGGTFLYFRKRAFSEFVEAVCLNMCGLVFGQH